MDLQVPVIGNLFISRRIKSQKCCNFGRHQERRRHTETLPSVSACLVRGSERIPIAYVGLMPFCWGCVRTVCQSWVRVYRPAHQGFTG